MRLIERIVDIVAHELDLDPIQIRKQNYVQPEDYPYETPNGCVYDSGDLPRSLDIALELIDVEKWRADLGVTYERLAYDMGFWNVEGSHAYAVISGTLTVTINGQSTVRTGTLAYTFDRIGDEWKIGAQAWGRTS